MIQQFFEDGDGATAAATTETFQEEAGVLSVWPAEAIETLEWRRRRRGRRRQRRRRGRGRGGGEEEDGGGGDGEEEIGASDEQTADHRGPNSRGRNPASWGGCGNGGSRLCGS